MTFDQIEKNCRRLFCGKHLTGKSARRIRYWSGVYSRKSDAQRQRYYRKRGLKAPPFMVPNMFYKPS